MTNTNVQDEIFDADHEHEEALYGRSHDLDGADEADEDEIIGEDEDLHGSANGPKRVSVQSADITIFEYERRLRNGRLRLDPDWQRNYVWKNNRASQFIESLLMGLPIPVMFIAENKDGKSDVIDGVQRLTTCYRFLNNEFKLSGLSRYKELNGKLFKDLDDDLRNRIEESTITCFAISSSVTQEMLFTIFERINSGGMRLNEMEIRNCIYPGALNSKIKELADNPDFIHAANAKNLKIRMDDRGLVLRFLAFYQLDYRNANGGLKRFLNGFLEDNKQPSEKLLFELENKFKAAMQSCVTVFGDHGFRVRQYSKSGTGTWASKVNASLFQVVSTSLARYPRPTIVYYADAIYEEYVDLLHDTRFMDSVTRATSSPVQIRYAFEAWNDRLRNLIDESRLKKEPRTFTRDFKEKLFEDDSACAICGNHIKSTLDAHVDHIDHYWRGGRTIPDNARLTHRVCNLNRSKTL